MYDRRFFASKLGLSALLSIAAMVTFNIYAVGQDIGLSPRATTAASPSHGIGPLVELA